MTNKQHVQTQFGTEQALEGYATSDIHARGESLAVLATLITPQPTWQALDVATGAGHTALLFAPHIAHVIATDLTLGMLGKTAQLAADRGLTNLSTRPADAEDLPFDANTFDLVTCRLAFHHFPNPRQAMAEFARVLKPGGILGFTDNIVVEDESSAAYYNTYEKLRDPSHHWVNTLPTLHRMLAEAGITVQQTVQLSKEFEFYTWADRQNVSLPNKQTLLTMMKNIPPALTPLFQPRWTNNTMYFSLWEVVITGTKN